MPRRARRGRRSAGDLAREKHVREAREFSAEMDGTDEDVKAYFFDLSPPEPSPILTEYERKYGQQARSYAQQTMPRWKNGSTRISGMVAQRLFALLPPRVPPKTKYKLTENLWHHVGPISDNVMQIGPDATLAAVVAEADRHISDVVTRYEIPDQLERRFDWLAAGDVGVKQQLLNQLRQAEKDLVTSAIRTQFPVMQDHSRGPDGRNTTRLTQTLTIGKHKLEMQFDNTAHGVTLEERGSATAAAAGCGAVTAALVLCSVLFSGFVIAVVT